MTALAGRLPAAIGPDAHAPSPVPTLAFVFERDLVWCLATLGHAYEFHPGVVHGGIVATLLDEVMAQAAGRALSSHVLTVGLRVRYIEPMRIDTEYRLEARIAALGNDMVDVHGEVVGSDTIAAATATFRAFRG